MEGGAGIAGFRASSSQLVSLSEVHHNHLTSLLPWHPQRPPSKWGSPRPLSSPLPLRPFPTQQETAELRCPSELSVKVWSQEVKPEVPSGSFEGLQFFHSPRCVTSMRTKSGKNQGESAVSARHPGTPETPSCPGALCLLRIT